MPVFAYQAQDRSQSQRNGTITSDSAALARLALRAQGLTVHRLAPAREGGRRRWPGNGARRRSNLLAEIWRQLSLLLRAGIPLAESLEVLGRQHRGAALVLLRELHEAVRGGQSLTDAIRQRPAWFDPLSVSLVRIGESSGALDQALAELADYATRRQGLRNQLVNVLVYPAILCLVALGVILFLMSYVVPQLADVLASAGQALPMPTRLVQAASDGILCGWPILIGALGGAGAALVLTLRIPRARRTLHRGLLRIPLAGDLLRKHWMSRLALMLAMLLRSNVQFVAALRTIRLGGGPGLLADELERLERCVEAGSTIAAPLKDSRVMPPLVVHVLAVGQDTGELPAMLEELRQGYEKEVQIASTRLLAVLEPALIILLAGIIGFVVFAALLPILETTRIVQ